MKRFAITLLLFVLSAKAWSCTCAGTASIEQAIARLPILVEAQVVEEERYSGQSGQRKHFGVTLRVKKLFKGAIPSETIFVTQLMCYASLYPELMKLGRTYVLPLHAISEDGNYEMARCSHSGMELIDGKLYTFEWTEQDGGLKRRLQLYKTYSDFQRELLSQPDNKK